MKRVYHKEHPLQAPVVNFAHLWCLALNLADSALTSLVEENMVRHT